MTTSKLLWNSATKHWNCFRIRLGCSPVPICFSWWVLKRFQWRKWSRPSSCTSALFLRIIRMWPKLTIQSLGFLVIMKRKTRGQYHRWRKRSSTWADIQKMSVFHASDPLKFTEPRYISVKIWWVNKPRTWWPVRKPSPSSSSWCVLVAPKLNPCSPASPARKLTTVPKSVERITPLFTTFLATSKTFAWNGIVWLFPFPQSLFEAWKDCSIKPRLMISYESSSFVFCPLGYPVNCY